jgi:YHS domain-containing protein
MRLGILATVTVLFVAGPALSSCCAVGMLAHAALPGHDGGCMGSMDHDHSHAEAATTRAQIGDEVTCPVDGMKLRVAADTPWTEYGGHVYYFCSEAERLTFLQQPERFVHR